MKLTLHFQDEKSDKFWRVETAECEMMTNWGKSGTSGRYEIKEFDSPQECEKQAEKLAASKRKKGYQEMPDFSEEGHCYFDTEEYGLNSLTSHPVYRQYFYEDLYYDCGDEESPFGSDEGSDTLYELCETFRKRPSMDFAAFPRQIIEEIWSLTYLPPDSTQSDEALKALAMEKINGLPGEQEILQSDQIILATAFGQIKITGKLNPALEQLAFQALDRMEQLSRIVGWSNGEPTVYVQTMRRDLQRFAKERRKFFKADRSFDKSYVLCADMVNDSYFPNFLVERIQYLLQAFTHWLEATHHAYGEIQAECDRITIAINEMGEEFEENDSEIETVARDSIGMSMKYILEWFGIDIDVEEAIRERDW